MEDDLMATLAGSDFPFLFSKWRIENLMGLATGFYVTSRINWSIFNSKSMIAFLGNALTAL